MSESIIKDNHTSDTIVLQVYGHYLSNGGRPQDFLDFTEDDIQIMYTVFQSEKVRDFNTIIKAIGKMLGAEER